MRWRVRGAIMTTLFLIVCTVSVIFFVMFLLKCFFTAPTLQTTKREAVAPAHKLIGARAVDSECGRRLFVHLEEEMADFLTAHGRTAAMLLAVIILLPLGLRAQTPGTTAAPQDSTSTGDQQIPPAVAKQLAAMQQRIDQLEQELKSRASQSPTADGVASAPAHALDDEQASAGGLSVTQENARAQQKKSDKPEPFAFADFTWMNGNSRIKEVPLQNAFFTPEIRFDGDYVYDFNHPQDDTISGSSEVFRANEFQVTQLGLGGDFHWDNVQARVMTQVGLYSQTTPRNDASPGRGQWNLADAYRYISEAWAGYHINALDGINIQGGIFLSYVGLFSYYQFDNWAYQPSYVSSNTPWFFNGMRVQIYPNQHLKIEPWLINGWQSYGRFNNRPGIGAQIAWRPNGKFAFIGNQYILGADTLGVPGRIRYHTDDSIEYKYYDHPDGLLDRMAFSLTGDMGCEHGGGVSCTGDSAKGPKQSFLGYMFYNRFWLHKDLYGVTFGGGQINNPGRYLVLLPPINGATAFSGTPYFTENPGNPFKAWDASATFDYMPSQYITFRMEYDHRHANVPYFSGPGGVTPPGGNMGAPGSLVTGWAPDLVQTQNTILGALLVMF
jgi:Putative beta-barrel porin-2, OmpL-like. bbp2